MPPRPKSRATPFRPSPNSIPNFVAASAIISLPARSLRRCDGRGQGATQSKYVARRETPVYIAENCTQCMECITACPDTALPNTSQEIGTVLNTAAIFYVKDLTEQKKIIAELKGVEDRARAQMVAAVEKREKVPFKDIIRKEVEALTTVTAEAKEQFTSIIDTLPLAYSNVPAIFRTIEKRRRALADSSRFSFPTSAKAAANACRFAAITTPCA